MTAHRGWHQWGHSEVKLTCIQASEKFRAWAHNSSTSSTCSKTCWSFYFYLRVDGHETHTTPTYKVLVLMHSEVLIGFHTGNSATHVIEHILHYLTKSEGKSSTGQCRRWSEMLKEGCTYKLLMPSHHTSILFFCKLMLLKHSMCSVKAKTHIYMVFIW